MLWPDTKPPALREKRLDHIWSWQMTSESDTTMGEKGLGAARPGVGGYQGKASPSLVPKAPMPFIPRYLGDFLLRGPTQLINLFHKHPRNISQVPHPVRSKMPPHPHGKVQGFGSIRDNGILYASSWPCCSLSFSEATIFLYPQQLELTDSLMYKGLMDLWNYI